MKKLLFATLSLAVVVAAVTGGCSRRLARSGDPSTERQSRAPVRSGRPTQTTCIRRAINDRAHGRIGMVDLADFRAKQILQVPNLMTSHGGIFATPDTRYVHISSKVPALKGWDATKGHTVTLNDHLERFAEIYRGYSTFIRVDENGANEPQ